MPLQTACYDKRDNVMICLLDSKCNKIVNIVVNRIRIEAIALFKLITYKSNENI